MLFVGGGYKLIFAQVYQQKLFEELRTEDELVILARGLGLMRLISNLLHSYDAAGNNLIVVVNAQDRENAWIGESLAEHAAISMSPKARGLTVVNTDFQTVGAREKMYTGGGIFSVTSRILVVDLLTGLLNPETITGLVVLHADKIVATSLEAFILRIYRQKNKVGFLKAFSDNPEAFTVGFSPLATMMRNMFLRKTSLWPRFHMHVAQSLEGKKKAEAPLCRIHLMRILNAPGVRQKAKDICLVPCAFCLVPSAFCLDLRQKISLNPN